MKASDLFVQCLENEGVERIFGLPGEENADLMMSLKGSSIEFVLCRHEQTAAFMADVYGRLTGKAGVCLGTLGPGATNLVTGVADGNMDRAPMVVITGQADTQRLHKESHQAMDVVQMFRPITKWARQIIHADNIPEVVRKAFKIAEMEKPGACLIELPEDIAEMKVKSKPIAHSKLRRPTPDEKAITLALELIRSAKRPVILAGNGAVRKRASKQLVEFAHRTGIPVINTFMGKGAIPASDPHCLYTAGLQAKDLVLCEIDRADLVITVGFDIVEYHPRLWNTGHPHAILHIDFLPAEVDADYPIEGEVVGDIANALWQLNEAIGTTGPLFDIAERQPTREAMKAEFAEHQYDQAVGAIKPQKVLWDARQCLGPEDIVLSDVGAHKMWIARHYQCEEPNTCLISNGFCSMGFALPGAMAAAMVYPDRKVLAIAGDAGALMNIQDLETAVRMGLSFVLMIWEDQEYGLIKWKQQAQFGDHTDLAFNNPDWVKLAEAFGATGMHVTESGGLMDALGEAFATPGPTLLSLPIDYSENMKLTKRLGEIACPI
ncbi:MAG: acetolactate synthase large subunit [Phycisphaerales bacterium]|nr:acetolactate synthase large subunit [Phycisphaerae bacterium]NNF43273.1 acetolactate synthase large subunit [Phycisphaerales bacterium]NNM24616.1 acetolactate synthase large subunit [Phycisphaerales bacterium]